MRFDGKRAEKDQVDAENKKVIEDVRLWREDYLSRKKTCTYCQYTGMMTVEHRATKTTYACRCGNCDAANRQHLSLTIPEWNASKMIHEYQPLI